MNIARLMQVGPYQHTRRMQRYVYFLINKSMRITLASLPYESPLNLYGKLLYCNIYNKNDIHCANHPTSLHHLRIILEEYPSSIISSSLNQLKLELSKRLLVTFGQLAISKYLEKTDIKIEIDITLDPQNERKYGAIRGFIFDSQMAVTRQSIELLENYLINFP
jgi:hypothetical protein